MSVAQRIAQASDRFYDAIRSGKADQAPERAERSGNLDALEGHKYCLVTTYKRDGEAVPTPVWFGLADGRLYFRTYTHSYKLKRLQRNPRVLVGPCNTRGVPKGPMVEAAARHLTSDQEREAAEGAIQSNYGLFRRIYEGWFSMKVPDAYVEVTPT
jgi:PPOX class probable F420-dependent enzyme